MTRGQHHAGSIATADLVPKFVSPHTAPAGFPVGRPGMERRVVRGGSWNNNQDHARCAYRNNNTPDNRNNTLGFRLVSVSHIVQA